ncbi:MAG: DUF4097 family beta strand repeat-containing protein [Pseudomonadota bacterium]
MTLPNIARLAGVSAALIFAGAANADTLQRTFDIGPGGTLVIDTQPGKVDIRTGGDDVRVEVVRTGDRAEEFNVEFREDGRGLTIKGSWPGVLSSWRSRPKARIEYNITVPRAFDIDVRTSGGSVAIDDLDGDVEARTSGGSIRLGQIAGEVFADTSGGSISLDGGGAGARLDTSGGSIRVGEVAGSLVASTSGGSIRIDGVGGNVRASTSGGSVEATLRGQPTEDCELSTSGGTVTLNVPSFVAIDVDASTSGGRVKSDLPLDQATLSKRSVRGQLNGGGPTMRLRSSGGGVRIRRAD